MESLKKLYQFKLQNLKRNRNNGRPQNRNQSMKEHVSEDELIETEGKKMHAVNDDDSKIKNVRKVYLAMK